MARTEGAARVDGRAWSLTFETGSTRVLRAAGFYAGHASKEELKNELRKQFWQQEARGDEEAKLLLGQARGDPEPSANSQTNEPAVLVAAGGKRKAVRGAVAMPADSSDQGAAHREDGHDGLGLLPVSSYLTRSAEKKSKLAAAEKAEKRKLAALQKRTLVADEKKRKLADNAKFPALGIRRAVTRSSHT